MNLSVEFLGLAWDFLAIFYIQKVCLKIEYLNHNAIAPYSLLFMRKYQLTNFCWGGGSSDIMSSFDHEEGVQGQI